MADKGIKGGNKKMTKCGKSVMPECKYFTTGGCMALFNCIYQVEDESMSMSTSIPPMPNSNCTFKRRKEMTNLQAPWIGHPADEEEPEIIYYCDWCDRPIYEGEDCYDIGGINVCEDCINNCRKTA